jgi:hypothetical protein
MRSLPLLVLTGFALACNRSDPPQVKAERPRADAEGAVVAYARRFLFLSGREAAPGAVVLNFETLSAPLAIKRQAGAWRARDGKWEGLLDLAWSEEPIREPWRLVPHGPLRLIADERGEVEALLSRAEKGAFRLAPALLLGEWSLDDAAQYRVRRAELRLGSGQPLAGVLFDAQSGAPGARGTGPSTELFLTDGGELHLILNAPDSASGQLWIRDGERAEVREGVALARDSTRANGPIRIEAAGGGLKGEFTLPGEVLALPRPRAAGEEDASPGALHLVRGWIELGGKRRTLFGVLRRGAA